MLERSLIEHCAPTLASIKTGSLFSLSFDAEDQLTEQLDRWNRRLAPKGVMIELMRTSERALVYVYRPKRLASDLNKPGVADFLAERGYGPGVQKAVSRLRDALCRGGEFPHEIGLFLGYPLCDVLGFIEHEGRCCRLCGCWKVYGDVCEAQRCFSRYRKCRDVYLRLHQAGRSVVDLTVAA